MPAVLTHDFFGRSVVDDVSRLLGFKTTDEKDAFLLGNQGPDPLFYLRVDPLMHKWGPLGSVMHDARPARLFASMRDAAERLEGHDRELARAYLAGFACHWLLDSTMHPFVYFWQHGICGAGVAGLDAGDGSIVHAEIERDFDEMVLYSETGRTVASYHPHLHVLRATPAVLAAVDKLYFYLALWTYERPIDPRTFSVAVKEFRLLQRLFDSPGGRKRAALSRVERLVTKKYSLLDAMSHRVRESRCSDFDNRDHGPWENPFTHEVSHDSFWDLFSSAQHRVLPTLADLFAADFDLDAAHALTADVNFEGELAPDDEAPFTW